MEFLSGLTFRSLTQEELNRIPAAMIMGGVTTPLPIGDPSLGSGWRGFAAGAGIGASEAIGGEWLVDVLAGVFSGHMPTVSP